MKSSLIVIAAVISLVKGSAAVDVAHVALAPHQRVILASKSPLPVDARFSFDAPAGPQFTNAEKQTQHDLRVLADGKQVATAETLTRVTGTL